MKVKREGELWIPEIVAISHVGNQVRLDRVITPWRHRMKTIGTRVTLSVHYVECVLPLTLEDQTAKVGDATLTEDQGLRALPNYSKRGTWYKIAPR
jgi:hypothetical protein